HGLEWHGYPRLEANALRRKLLRSGRQTRPHEPPQSRVYDVEYGLLWLARIRRPDIQNDSVFHRDSQRHGLRRFLRQHLPQQLRFRKRVARLFLFWSRGRRAELLFHRWPGTQENRPAIHGARRPHASSAALVARLSAEPLQLLSRSACSRSRPNFAREKDSLRCHLF